MPDLDKPDQAKDYDKHAKDFANKAPQLMTWVYGGSKAFEKTLGEFFNRNDVKFLDLGCASGRVERFLSEHGVPVSNMTGVEISPEEVEIAKQQEDLAGAHFQVGDITNVELPQSEFDVALSHMVFEHLDNEQLLAALTNAFNSLKPGGTLAFVVTHPGKMTASDGVSEEGWFDTTAPWGGTVRNYFRSLDTFKKLVEDAGFEIEVFDGVEVAPEAELEDQEKYAKYKHYGPIRLSVKAKKPMQE